MKTIGRTGTVRATVLSLLLMAGCCNSDKTLTLDLGGGVTMKLVRIEAGTFTMGSPKFEPEDVAILSSDKDTRHEVTISRPFHIGTTEVTRGQFAAFVTSSGYKTTAEKKGGWARTYDGRTMRKVTGASWRKAGFEQTDTHPVVCVSWHDAMAFCAWLSQKVGRTVSLPTQAQWEYACRAGTTTHFSFGDEVEELHKYANYCDRSFPIEPSWKHKDHDDGYAFTAPVGSYRPNAWDLYDMHANAWEWCSDWYGDPYANADARDPKGPDTGRSRVIRGGSCSFPPLYCGSATIDGYPPDVANGLLGFRVVVEAD